MHPTTTLQTACVTPSSSLNSSPSPQQPWLFYKKKGDISNYLLTVCFCLKSLPPASLSSLREGKLEKEYADIVKLNLIGTVKTARVW